MPDPPQPWVRRTGSNGLSMIEGGQPGGPAANPFVTVERVIGAGHCIHRDDPGRFHQLMRVWFHQASHA